jgi:integrase
VTNQCASSFASAPRWQISPLRKLSAHSLRSGFVTEAGKQNISLGGTMAMTGHRSVQTVMGYYQSGDMSTSRAARLMDHSD